MAKFKVGDRVRINPLATERDFEYNSCIKGFMDRLDEVFEIRQTGKTGEKDVYYISGWWMLENCITNVKESNEL